MATPDSVPFTPQRAGRQSKAIPMFWENGATDRKKAHAEQTSLRRLVALIGMAGANEAPGVSHAPELYAPGALLQQARAHTRLLEIA